MKKITDYKIISYPTSTTLWQEVRNQITAGWQPYEAPFREFDDVAAAYKWYHALVKYEWLKAETTIK